MADEVMRGYWDGGQSLLAFDKASSALALNITCSLFCILDGIWFFIASLFNRLRCRFLLFLANCFVEFLQLHVVSSTDVEAVMAVMTYENWSTERANEAALEGPRIVRLPWLVDISK